MNNKPVKEIIFSVETDGTIRTIYKDELKKIAEDMKADITTVCRASEVEWEVIEKPLNPRFPMTQGWSIRAAHRPQLAIRWRGPGAEVGEPYVTVLLCSDNEELAIALFESRENALKWEVHFFDSLLPPKESRAT